jgi:hypothetical protein
MKRLKKYVKIVGNRQVIKIMFRFSVEELRAIIEKKVKIIKCPECKKYSGWNIGCEAVDENGELIPVNLLQEYNDDDLIDWQECRKCDGLGYEIKFIN